MPGMSVAKLKVLVEADTRAAEKQLRAFHRHLEQSFQKSGVDAGKAADRGVSQGLDRDRNLVSRSAQKAGGDAGQAFSNSFAEKVARQAGGVLLKGREVKVKANLDSTGLRSQVARAVRVAGAGQEVRIRVRADKSALDQFRNALQIAMRDTKGFRSELAALAFPVVASGIGLAASALAALGSAAIGAAASVAPLVGLLGALPGLAAAGGQGFGVLKLAFSGVGDAVKALGKSQVKGAVSAGQSASAQRAAAEQIRTARMSVVRAERDAADAAVEGARRVQDAQRNLSDSQRSARQAQEDLTRARRDARLALIDLRLEVQRNALSQERAALNVEVALKKLQAARADPTTDPLRLRDLDLDYREAVQSLKEITEERRRSNADLVRANRVGISGSDQVRSAAERVADAQRDTADAVRGVRDAQMQAARAGADAAARITEAHHDLAAAVASASERTATLPAALQAVNEKLAALSPAGQRFAKVLFSLKPILDRLKRTAQEGLFPGLTTALGSLKRLEPVATRVIDKTARMFGRLAVAGAEMVTSGPWRKDLETIGNRNVVVLERAGQTAFNVADALRNVTIAAGPLVDWLSKLVLGWSESAKAAAQTGRDTGKLAAFFEDTRRTVEQWLRIGGNFAQILYNIGRAARPLGDDLVRSLDRAAASMAALTGSAQGQTGLRKFFDEARPALREIGLLARDVAKAFISIARDPDLPKVISQIRTDLLPVLVDFLHQMRTAAPVFLELITTIVGGMLKLINTVPGLGKLVGIIVGLNVAFRALRLVNTALGINAVARALLGVGPGGKAVQFLGKQLLVLAVGAPRATAAIALLGNASVATGTKLRVLTGMVGALSAVGAAIGIVALEANELFRMFKGESKTALDPASLAIRWFGQQLGFWKDKSKEAAEQQDRTSAAAARGAGRMAALRTTTYSTATAQASLKDALATVNTTLVGYRKQAEQAGGSLSHSLGTQKLDFQTWSKDIQTLIKRGMSPKEILVLRDMGPQYIRQFASATDIEFAKLKIIWQQRVRAARIAAQLEALLAGAGSAQSIATGLASKDKIVRDAAKDILSHLPKKVQTKVEVLYDQARNIKILRKFAKDLHTNIGGKPVLIDPRTGRAEPIRNARGNLFGEKHSAQIARAGAMRVWAEPETGGEAYIPLARSKRPRSERILADVAGRFGMQLQRYAAGGVQAGGGGARQGTGPGSKYLIQKMLAMTLPSYSDVGKGGKQGSDGLVPHVRAAREYVRSVFGIGNIGGFARSGHVANSDHYTGHALDVMTGNRKLHQAVIQWFMGHPAAKYWISYGRIAMARQNWAARAYSGSSPHRDHVHLSFNRLGGILDKVGKLKGFANGGPVNTTGPLFAHAGEGILNRRAMAQVGPGGLNAMNRGSGGGVGGVYIAPGAVQIVVSGDIAGDATLRRLESAVDRKLDDLAGQILAGRRS